MGVMSGCLMGLGFFGGDKNVLKLDMVMVVNILKTTKLHVLKQSISYFVNYTSTKNNIFFFLVKRDYPGLSPASRALVIPHLTQNNAY